MGLSCVEHRTGREARRTQQGKVFVVMPNTTVINIPHEKIALELCGELVKQGKTFRCERTPSGWEFEVLS